ncbi:DUF4242 domain-containing protein [Rhodococcus rhodochrous]|uniref:DUF4242 domain-containing protein n=1 Tax=Rhodococcus rhodochrous KG-21 TaxID=1441923 RepID=A0A0M8PN65_RHORH|nr:DUF4242 domain-containing protein [Rhodococcus rhodochrous]KOS55138.1 hypothetical protein Z051_16390 [Rhodococcus rhodochrous KG-21]
MSLYLYELVPTAGNADQALKEFDTRIAAAGGELIEAQVTDGAQRVFAIAEFDGCSAPDLDAGSLSAAELDGPHQVRLVGAELDQIKAARPEAGYLVEWDIPDTIDMETYLARKKANSPKYANVPEVSFLRTYVREDMDKCLCFYNAPDEAAVFRAREAVSTPVDRIHTLES